MDTKKQVYFKRGQYLFGRDDFSKEEVNEDNLIPIDKYIYAGLSDVILAMDGEIHLNQMITQCSNFPITTSLSPPCSCVEM